MKKRYSREDNSFSASQEISRFLMEPDGLLPHSQVPATCPEPPPFPLPEHPS